MSLPADLPVVDHHCHLSPNGEGIAAAERFRRAGGTHLFLTTQQYGPGPPTTLAGYVEQFETTERLATRIREDLEIEVYVVVAPYPIDLLRQAETQPLSAAMELHRNVLREAGRWVAADRAVALGEVGRPHFPVTEEIREASEELLLYAFEVARDAGCPAVVHSEDLDAAGFRQLADAARRVGLSIEHVIKHYARTVVPPSERGGIVPSFLARRDMLDSALGTPGPWFLETDFLDDPRRPGAVLDLATVPRRAHEVIVRDPEGVEELRVPFQHSVEKVYGFRVEAGGR